MVRRQAAQQCARGQRRGAREPREGVAVRVGWVHGERRQHPQWARREGGVYHIHHGIVRQCLARQRSQHLPWRRENQLTSDDAKLWPRWVASRSRSHECPGLQAWLWERRREPGVIARSLGSVLRSAKGHKEAR